MPDSFRLAPLGSVWVSMRTALRVSPASTSLKPKSAAANVWLASSLIVIVLSAPVGVSLTLVTVMVKAFSKNRPPASVVRTRTV